MDLDEEEELSGRRRKRRWIAVLVSLPFLGIMGFGVWFFLTARQTAHEKALVEQVSGAAFGCVVSVRGDAPEAWGLERALEHMSRMERVTRDAPDAPDTARFRRLADDASRGCEELGSLMNRASDEAPGLYFAVPAALAQPPDAGNTERWFRRILPKSRHDVEELTRQIRAMEDAINARRGEHDLMPTALPVDGRGAAELARVITLEPLPREVSDRPITEAWPTPSGVLVLRRGSIERVPCDTRYINRTSCYTDFVQSIGWDGTPSPRRQLERPASVSYWAAFAPSDDGTLWAVGLDLRDRGIVGRYAPEGTTAETAPLAAPIDAVATMAQVIGGMAVYASDESVWVAEGTMRFAAVDAPPPQVVLSATEAAVESGITLDGVGTLGIFGSQEDGFTSRLTTATGDVLLRMIDAHSRVRAIPLLRALRTGQTVALLQRAEDAADALVISADFGRSWLSDPTPAAQD